MQNNFDGNNQGASPEVAVIGSPSSGTAAIAIVLFDKNAPQILKFKREDDDGFYELEYTIQGLSDADLKEFDRLSFVKVETAGDSQIFRSDDLDACSWFFEQNVVLTGGFDGELPENWLETFDDLLERQNVVREFLSVYALGSEKTKTKKRISFGQAKTRKMITLKASFNNEEVECLHMLPEDNKKHLHKYIQITQGYISKKGKTGTFLPETFEKLGNLYDAMGVTSTGYEPDGIPLNHKALVMREAFQTQAETARKK